MPRRYLMLAVLAAVLATPASAQAQSVADSTSNCRAISASTSAGLVASKTVCNFYVRSTGTRFRRTVNIWSCRDLPRQGLPEGYRDQRMCTDWQLVYRRHHGKLKPGRPTQQQYTIPGELVVVDCLTGSHWDPAALKCAPDGDQPPDHGDPPPSCENVGAGPPSSDYMLRGGAGPGPAGGDAEPGVPCTWGDTLPTGGQG